MVSVICQSRAANGSGFAQTAATPRGRECQFTMVNGQSSRVLNWPNRISLLRLLLVAPFLVFVANQNDATWPHARHVAVGIFFVMAVSDFLDGILARRLNQRTRLGAILDPIADKILIICSVIALSLPDSSSPAARIPNWVVVAVVAKDLYVILGFLVVYLVTDRFRIRPTIAGKLCTLGQLAMVISVLLAEDLNRLGEQLGTLVALCFFWVVAALVVLAMISYTRLGVAFVSEGQKPLDDSKHPR